MPTPDSSKPDVLAPVKRASSAQAKPVTLNKRKDFLAASKSGLKGVASSIIIQINPNPTYTAVDANMVPKMRYGLTASKKTGNAVCRNRSKRRLRTLVADHLAEQGSIGCDYVLIARHNTAAVPYSQLVSDFQYALKKAHRLIHKRSTTTIDELKGAKS